MADEKEMSVFEKLSNELSLGNSDNMSILEKYQDEIFEADIHLWGVLVTLLHSRESLVDIDKSWVPDNDDSKEVIKNACQILGYSFKTLAEKIGVAESSLRSASSTGKVTQQVINSIKMLYEIECLRDELSDYQSLRDAIRKAIQQ
nr:MAG TPA: Regulatory protein [Caudoviricetes sp.]